MNPTLCRVSRYFRPGLPKPATSRIFDDSSELLTCFCGCFSLASAATCSFSFRGPRLSHQCDDDLASNRWRNAFRELHISNVESLAQLEMFDIEIKSLRQILGKAVYLQGVNLMLEQSTHFHPSWLAVEVKWKQRANFFVFPNGLKIDVSDSSGKNVVLNRLNQNQLVFLFRSLNNEVDENVLTLGAMQEISDFLLLDLNGIGALAPSVNYAGDDSLTT